MKMPIIYTAIILVLGLLVIDYFFRPTWVEALPQDAKAEPAAIEITEADLKRILELRELINAADIKRAAADEFNRRSESQMAQGLGPISPPPYEYKTSLKINRLTAQKILGLKNRVSLWASGGTLTAKYQGKYYSFGFQFSWFEPNKSLLIR